MRMPVLFILLYWLLNTTTAQPTLRTCAILSGDSSCTERKDLEHFIIRSTDTIIQKLNEQAAKDERDLERLASRITDTIIQKLNDYGAEGSPQNCLDWKANSGNRSGVYPIIVNGKTHQVYCDMTTDGGGWTVFQKRIDGSVDFYRNWQNYTDGFGDLKSEHWLGLALIHTLTNKVPHELRVDLESFQGEHAYAKYSYFFVGPMESNYALLVTGYQGNAGDSMAVSQYVDKNYIQNGMAFTTYDKDNDGKDDGSCAVLRKGAWWYNNCYRSNLISQRQDAETPGSIIWRSWKGPQGLSGSTMMMRPFIRET